MDRGGHFAGRAGHAPVRHQRHFVALVLQHAERRRQAVQLGHAIGLRPLEAHHGDKIHFQRTGLERRLQLFLRMEDFGRRLDHMPPGIDGGNFCHSLAQSPGQHLQPAARLERPVGRAQHLVVARGRRRRPAHHNAVHADPGLHRIGVEPLPPHGFHVAVQQPGPQKLADEIAHAAGRLEMVHIGHAVGVDARQQRYHLGKGRKILPGQRYPRRLRHRHQMHRVVGRAAGGEQAHHAVDDGARVDHAADRRIFVAERRDRQRAPGRLAGQGVAQGRVGVDEARPRRVQAHDLHQHLVRVGGAVEGAGARPVIGFRLRFKQRITPDLALGIELARLGLGVVGETRRHRAGGDEHGGQMAKGERADHQPRHDLVADAQKHRRVEHLMRQGDGGGERDDIAREQREFHPGLALGDAIAHGRHPARHLRHAARRTRRRADQIGKALVGVVGRQHVVVRRDDAEVGHHIGRQMRLVARPAGGKTMREIGAAELPAARPLVRRGGDGIEIALARPGAALGNRGGDVADAGVEGHGRLLGGGVSGGLARLPFRIGVPRAKAK